MIEIILRVEKLGFKQSILAQKDKQHLCQIFGADFGWESGRSETGGQSPGVRPEAQQVQEVFVSECLIFSVG
ncbi:hypothetical protein [Neptuniibacter halophilus]|uniref:hypothetical protein n=1 Tax=Neptuniibacter halophilus TaxID=651666 RepID=UPI0025730BDF|nr:hypothetical protein [Neptuniibacter halophilus]